MGRIRALSPYEKQNHQPQHCPRARRLRPVASEDGILLSTMNKLGLLGLLGFLGFLGAVNDNPGLFGLFGLFALFSLFWVKK